MGTLTNCTSGCAGTKKPLPDVLSQVPCRRVLYGERRTDREDQVKEPGNDFHVCCVICRRDWMWWPLPFYHSDQLLKSQEVREAYLGQG